MLYLSIALFLGTLVAALFGFVLASDPTFAQMAQLAAASLFGASILFFLIDRAWGAYMLRRMSRMTLDERDRDRGHFGHRRFSTR